jgi:hypothetical protein
MDVRRSVREPPFDAEVNVLGTIGLLENCIENRGTGASGPAGSGAVDSLIIRSGGDASRP